MTTADPDRPAARDDEERAARRARRRAERRARFDTSIPSPCIAVCQIDNARNRCIGCLRTVDEIREWPIMSAEEKTATLTRIAERRAEMTGSAGTAANKEPEGPGA